MMEQHVFIKITLEEGLNALENHRKLVERSGREPLSSAAVTDWRREFSAGRQDVEDNPRPGRPPDFGLRLRVEQTSTAFPNSAIASIAEITGYATSTVFDILTQALHLKFRSWRCVLDSLSDAQKLGRIDGAKLLRVELLAAKRRNWTLFWTSDESWILWSTQRSGSWRAVDQKLPVRMKQTVDAPKSMLTVFFNFNSFAVVHLLPGKYPSMINGNPESGVAFQTLCPNFVNCQNNAGNQWCNDFCHGAWDDTVQHEFCGTLLPNEVGFITQCSKDRTPSSLNGVENLWDIIDVQTLPDIALQRNNPFICSI
jgi:hypothetical protein